MHVDPISTIPFSGPIFGTESLSQAGMKCEHFEGVSSYRVIEFKEYPKLFLLVCSDCAARITEEGGPIVSSPIYSGTVN